MDIKSIHCVITGITGDTARGVADTLLRKGVTVFGTTRPGNPSQPLRPVSAHEFLVEMDPLNSESLQVAIGEIISRVGQIHVWINIIGGFDMGQTVEDFDHRNWERMLDINFKTALYSTQAILPHFKKFQQGRLINFGSAAVETNMAMAAPYLVSKSAVHTLTRACASELSGEISCNAILPRTIDTPKNRAAMPDADFSTWVSPLVIAEKIKMLIEGSSNGELIHV